MTHQKCVYVFTFSQDLWNLGMVGAKGTVDLKTIGIIKEGSAQGEEHFLLTQKQHVVH